MKVAVMSVLLPTATFEEEPSPITISMSGVLNLQEEQCNEWTSQRRLSYERKKICIKASTRPESVPCNKVEVRRLFSCKDADV